jgi:hypothetical protein
MAFEDWTTYTEVDNANNDITVNGANSVTGNTMTRIDTAYLYDDKGAAHFGIFEHDHDCKPITATYASSYAAIWGISNTIGDVADWAYGLCVFVWHPATNARFMLYERGGAGVIDDSIGLTWNITYYCVTDRDATPIITTIIYNEAAHLTIKDTIFGACAATICRYVFGIASYDTNTTSRSITFDCYNLDLNEAVADVSAGIKLWDGTADIELVKDDTSPVKIRTPTATIGIKLVATGDGNASAIRFFDGATTKAFKKKI